MFAKEYIGITFSSFDLLHTGHVQFLSRCKDYCDKLIVGIHMDPTVERPFKNKPVQSIIERQLQIRGCKYVDEHIVYETEKDIEDILALIHPHMRFLGSDYSPEDNFTGKELQDELGINTLFIPRKHKFSSSELRDRVENQNSEDDKRIEDNLNDGHLKRTNKSGTE